MEKWKREARAARTPGARGQALVLMSLTLLLLTLMVFLSISLSGGSTYFGDTPAKQAPGHGVGHASSELARHYTGSSPIDEDGFFMSYRGEEDGYVETRTPTGEAVDMRDRPYNTGSAEHKPAMRRDSNRCFLGLARC